MANKFIKILMMMSPWFFYSSGAVGAEFNIEVKPLGVLQSFYSFSLDAPVKNKWGWGLSYEAGDKGGIEMRQYGASLLYKPYQRGIYEVLSGFKTEYTQRTYSSQLERDSITWVKRKSNDVYDSWTVEEKAVHGKLLAALRVRAYENITARLELSVARKVYSKVDFVSVNIEDNDRSPSSNDLSTYRQEILFYAGLAFH